ncbi:MAG: heavy metal translocating P-type ATPase [Gammaproteobacteria bacterium]|nr:heavy metal translocating P-type ATPase [Gammaproteobacteria bacterium]
MVCTSPPAEQTTTSPASVCFHCGLPVPQTQPYRLTVDNEERYFCCPGCRAVTEAIVAGGLTDYYRYRSAPAHAVETDEVHSAIDWQVYDQPAIQRGFVHAKDEHIRSASLLLEGIVCAACVWLNERHVGALPGVQAFRVNYSTQQAYVEWDERVISLGGILEAIAAIGYRAYPFDTGRRETLFQRERATALRRVTIAGLGAMQVMMLALALYIGDFYAMDAASRQLLRWISLIITVPVLIYASRPFFQAAWRGLRHWQLGMDVPVALAIVAAFSASAWHTWLGSGEIYFDSVTMFTFLLLGSRFLEMNSRQRAWRIAEQQVRMLPATAVRLTGEGIEETVAVADLRPGDRVLIRPGATIPADGRIVEGASSVDESLLSGESLPLCKSKGDALVGGAVNVESPLLMRIEKVGADTVLATLVRLMERAGGEKPHWAQLADRVAGWFVGGVLLIAIGVAGWWALHDPDATFAITLSVLVVTCPCALSLATPTALTAATAQLTRRGLLATRQNALEVLARVTHVVFDKTGTLTQGRFQLLDVMAIRDQDERHCLALAAALARASEHPISRAVNAACQGERLPEAVSLSNIPGAGMEGHIGGLCYRLGRPDFVQALSGSSTHLELPIEPGATVVALGDTQGLLGWLRLADTLRPESRKVVEELKAMGLDVSLLSGDRVETVREVASQLQIGQARGGMSPADKLTHIQALQRQGAIVAMVGDGVNDAPVLGGASVSLAMGHGTQLAHAAADMIILSGDLRALVIGVRVARSTLGIIRQNMAWAVGYNLFALPLAAAGWIAPWAAALGMSLSSLLVVANALRLTASR